MSHLGTVLRSLFVQGPSAKRQIDRLLAADEADPREDLKATFDQVGLEPLLLLQRKFCEGRVVERCYRRRNNDGQTEACLLYWLLGIASREQLFAYPFGSEETFKAVVRTIRFWDYGVLDQQTVWEVLETVIEKRQGTFLNAKALAALHKPLEAAVRVEKSRPCSSAV